MTEKEIQSNIMIALGYSPLVAFAIVNTCGTVKVKGRHITLGFPGLPDITGMLRTGQFFGIEVKNEKGKVSDIQIEFIEKINKNGGKAGIARSVEDALTIVRSES